MAQAGTPSNLTRQPATPTVNAFWRAFITAVLVLAVAVGIVAVSGGRAPVAPASQTQSQPGAVDIHKVVGHKGAMIYQ